MVYEIGKTDRHRLKILIFDKWLKLHIVRFQLCRMYRKIDLSSQSPPPLIEKRLNALYQKYLALKEWCSPFYPPYTIDWSLNKKDDRMMNILLITFVIDFVVTFTACKTTESTANEPTLDTNKCPHKALELSWSAYQGSHNWTNAKAKCVGNGMRLPTQDELPRLYNNSDTSWKNNGCVNLLGNCNFWSTNEYSKYYKYVVSMKYGIVHDVHKNSEYGVRCVC